MVCAHHVAQIRSKLIQAATQLDLSLDFVTQLDLSLDFVTQLDLSLDFVTQGKDGIRAPFASLPGLPPPPQRV
jgi:hypothetical protein